MGTDLGKSTAGQSNVDNFIAIDVSANIVILDKWPLICDAEDVDEDLVWEIQDVQRTVSRPGMLLWARASNEVLLHYWYGGSQ